MDRQLEDFTAEFERYRTIGDKAIAQVGDAALNKAIAVEGNSIGMLVRHIGGPSTRGYVQAGTRSRRGER
jgi:hypothetical protein